MLPVIREHIVSTPDTCGGKPRIAGSRIQVKHLAIMHERQGMSPEEIVSEFPHLTLADVYAALAYYHDHRESINAEIAADRAWYEEQKARQPSRLKEMLKTGRPMPRTIRFHLDENCTKAIARGLRRQGIDVTTTSEAGLIGATDEEQAADALSKGRVIFTQDRDFLRIHTAGFHMPGSPTARRTRGASAK